MAVKEILNIGGQVTDFYHHLTLHLDEPRKIFGTYIIGKYEGNTVGVNQADVLPGISVGLFNILG